MMSTQRSRLIDTMNMTRFKSRFSIGWQLLALIVPVAVIPLFIVVAVTINSISGHLIEQNHAFTREMLNQVSMNLDFIVDQYARTLSTVYQNRDVVSTLRAPAWNSREEERLARNRIRGNTRGRGLLSTITEKIDGFVYIVETDRNSLIFRNQRDHTIHRISASAPALNYEQLINDPLYKSLKEDNSKRIIMGKLCPKSVSGMNCDRYTSILFPFYFTPPGSPESTFKKFMLVILQTDFIPRFYQDIDSLQTGTLYIMDQFDRVSSYNHPSSIDYYDYDTEKGTYLLGDDDPNDSLELMSFNEYRKLNTNQEILKTEKVLKLLDQMRTELNSDGSQSNVTNKSHTVRYGGMTYQLSLVTTSTSRMSLLFFKPLSFIRKPVYKTLRRIILIFLFSTAVVILISFLVSRRFSMPIKDLSRTALKVAHGDLRIQVFSKSTNELGVLTRIFSSLISNLAGIVSSIKTVSSRINNTGLEIQSISRETIEDSAKITDEINTSRVNIMQLNNELQNAVQRNDMILQDVESTMQSVKTQQESIHDTVKSADSVNTSMADVRDILKEQQGNSEELAVLARSGFETMEDSVEAISLISRSTSDIMEMVEVINTISDQTDLLAMNAAIEAAHAGESGKGFSVVADEIRKLAEMSGANARSISVSLQQTVADIHKASLLSKNAGESFYSLVDGIAEIARSMSEINSSIGELSSHSQQILSFISTVEINSNTIYDKNLMTKQNLDQSQKNLGSVKNLSETVIQEINAIATSSQHINILMENLYKHGKQNIDDLSQLASEIEHFKTEEKSEPADYVQQEDEPSPVEEAE
jgi:methyl-accepting chemotaxis protein